MITKGPRPYSCLLVLVIAGGLSGLAASQSPSQHMAADFGDSVTIISDTPSVDPIKLPALVLVLPASSSSPGTGLVETWRQLGDWAMPGVSVGVEFGRVDVANPQVHCLQAEPHQQTIHYEGKLELTELQLFAAQACRRITLDRGSFSGLEKYSANPTKHDTAFNRMVQQLTDASFASRTRSRRAVVISSTAMCPLCKILRPAFNRLRTEPSLAKVAILALDIDKQKGNAAAPHVGTSPTILFLHSGSVTSRFAIKPSKDTAAYAADLVTWAIRQDSLPEHLIAAAASVMNEELLVNSSANATTVSTVKQEDAQAKMPEFTRAFPVLTDEAIASLGSQDGLIVIYHVKSCWQCRSTYDQMWALVASGSVMNLKAARHEMPMFPVHSKNQFGSHLCQEPFCIVYWRGKKPVARFSGPITLAALQDFWNAMGALNPEKTAVMAEFLSSEKYSHGMLDQEAKVVQHLKTKEHQSGAHIHTEL